MLLAFSLSCGGAFEPGTAGPLRPVTAPMSYEWWRTATRSQRVDAIAVAIQGIRAGWVFGGNADRADVQANLDDARSTAKEMDVALRPRRRGMPTFLKPPATYISKIDSVYALNPDWRIRDIALVLLCFSDVKILDCRDVSGA
jgi:hypothetical protein